MTPITRRDFAILQDQMLAALNNLTVNLQQPRPPINPTGHGLPLPTGLTDGGDGDDEGESEAEFDVRPRRKTKKQVQHRPAAYNAFQVSQPTTHLICLSN
jgi:hypothetical protein